MSLIDPFAIEDKFSFSYSSSLFQTANTASISVKSNADWKNINSIYFKISCFKCFDNLVYFMWFMHLYSMSLEYFMDAWV